MSQNNDNRSGWLERMAEAELECGGVLAGRLGSPDDHPMEPVLEDEATLRRILREKMEQMRQKQAAREKYLQDHPAPQGYFR